MSGEGTSNRPKIETDGQSVRVGRCIYCGANSYKEGIDEPLHDEHVIPRGLGGSFILREASCQACERQINQFEQRLMRQHWLTVRQELYGIPARAKNRPAEYTQHRNPATGEALRWKVGQFPTMMTFPVMGTDAWMDPSLPVPRNMKLRTVVIGKDYDHPPSDPSPLADVPRVEVVCDTALVCRLMAKIAHCVTVFALGLDRIQPVLQKFILGEEEEKRFFYVGSSDALPPVDKGEPFEVSYDAGRHHDSFGVFIYIRLFTDLPLPEYVVYSAFPPIEWVADLMEGKPLGTYRIVNHT